MRKAQRLVLLALLFAWIALAACTPTVAPPAPAQGKVTLFVQPDDGREPLLRLIRGAQERIDLTIYLFSDETIAEALTDAARRGVQVRVLMEMEPFGGGATNAAMARQLRRAGVNVKATNPVFRYTHQKSLVVDGRTGVIMTMNLTPSSFARNREFGVIFTQPQWVSEMQTVFDADWNRVTPELPDRPYLVWSPVNARETILGLIRSAQERLDLEEADLADDEIADALVAAARSGVAVRLIRPTPGAHEEDELAHVQRLLAAGARVAYLDSPRVHAKVIVVDRRQVLIGSMNLTMTSLDFNRELGIVLQDADVVRQVLAVFERDWQRATPARATRGGPPVISPEDAARFVGAEVIVEGMVVNTHDTGRVTFLDFSRRKEDLSIVIFARDYAKFPEPPAQYYLGKVIRVRGIVKRYQGALEIIVESPDQIEVVASDER